MPTPKKDETKVDFLSRCMGDPESINSFPDENQRFVVCSSKWESHYAKPKLSFDYDGVLSTAKGTELAKELIKDNDVYIISARHSKDGMLNKAKEIGIDNSKVYATGSNNDKIRKILELKIETHYDNNPKVIEKLGKIGKLFNG
jgi:hypothetical protein